VSGLNTLLAVTEGDFLGTLQGLLALDREVVEIHFIYFARAKALIVNGLRLPA
jgi:hypothetical protein